MRKNVVRLPPAKDREGKNKFICCMHVVRISTLYLRKRESNLISVRSHGAQHKIFYSLGVLVSIDWIWKSFLNSVFPPHHSISSSYSRQRHKEYHFSPLYSYSGTGWLLECAHTFDDACWRRWTNKWNSSFANRCERKKNKKNRNLFLIRVRCCRRRIHTADWLVKWRLCIFINGEAKRKMWR